MEEKLIKSLREYIGREIYAMHYDGITEIAYFCIHLNQIDWNYYDSNRLFEIYSVGVLDGYTKISMLIRKENIERVLNEATFQ